MNNGEYFAVVNEGDVIIFTSFEDMEAWTRQLVDGLKLEDFDFDFFFDNGYSEVYSDLTWTNRVAFVN